MPWFILEHDLAPDIYSLSPVPSEIDERIRERKGWDKDNLIVL